MRKITFELCTETLAGCQAAADGGAARIELCSALSEGGLTPSHALIAAAVRATAIPVHVLVRPRGGTFCYSDAELAMMAEDVGHARELGAAGVVLGVLTPERTVDVARTSSLMEHAGGMAVTFHRAFDETASLPAALETIIALGCDRVLTSGGHPDVLQGADTLCQLVQQADGRIHVAAGGGLRVATAAEVSRTTGAEHFHGSLRSRIPAEGYAINPSSVRAMIEQLQAG